MGDTTPHTSTAASSGKIPLGIGPPGPGLCGECPCWGGMAGAGRCLPSIPGCTFQNPNKWGKSSASFCRHL